MKHFKKTTATRITAALLSFAMLFGLTACGSGGGKSTGGSTPAASDAKSSSTGTAAESGMAESGTGRAGQASDLTLEDGEAKLLYRDETFLAVAYHGPYKDMSASFARPDGELLNAFVGYGNPSDGWTLVISKEFPADYKDDVLLSVSDYSAPKNADGKYQQKLYPLTGTMTKDEAKAIGLHILEDHICTFVAGTSYGSDNFEASIYIRFLDEYHDQSLDQIEGLVDRLSFYAEDGTPLEQCFPDHTLKFVTGSLAINLDFMNKNKGDSSTLKEKNKEMCDKLKELNPYAIYTAKDGATQKLPFFTEEDSKKDK